MDGLLYSCVLITRQPFKNQNGLGILKERISKWIVSWCIILVDCTVVNILISLGKWNYWLQFSQEFKDELDSLQVYWKQPV